MGILRRTRKINVCDGEKEKERSKTFYRIIMSLKYEMKKMEFTSISVNKWKYTKEIAFYSSENVEQDENSTREKKRWMRTRNSMEIHFILTRNFCHAHGLALHVIVKTCHHVFFYHHLLRAYKHQPKCSIMFATIHHYLFPIFAINFGNEWTRVNKKGVRYEKLNNVKIQITLNCIFVSIVDVSSLSIGAGGSLNKLHEIVSIENGSL